MKRSSIAHFVVEKVADALKVNTCLKALDLRENPIGSESAMALVEALKVNTTLEKLELPWFKIIDDDGEALGEIIKLNRIWTELDVGSTRVKPSVVEKIAEALTVNTCLKSLDLTGSSIKAEGAKPIVEALKMNCTLERVEMTWSRTINDGGVVLSDLLKLNRIGPDLTLRVPVPTAVVSRIFHALADNTTLKCLVLSNCKIGDEGANVIAEAFKSNCDSNLEILDLSANPFGIHSAQRIVQGLAGNRSLKQIAFPLFSAEEQSILLPYLFSSRVLLKCLVGGKNILQMKVDFWKQVQCDCLSFLQLFKNRSEDAGTETWRFARALYLVRKGAWLNQG